MLATFGLRSAHSIDLVGVHAAGTVPYLTALFVIVQN